MGPDSTRAPASSRRVGRQKILYQFCVRFPAVGAWASPKRRVFLSAQIRRPTALYDMSAVDGRRYLWFGMGLMLVVLLIAACLIPVMAWLARPNHTVASSDSVKVCLGWSTSSGRLRVGGRWVASNAGTRRPLTWPHVMCAHLPWTPILPVRADFAFPR